MSVCARVCVCVEGERLSQPSLNSKFPWHWPLTSTDTHHVDPYVSHSANENSVLPEQIETFEQENQTSASLIHTTYYFLAVFECAVCYAVDKVYNSWFDCAVDVHYSSIRLYAKISEEQKKRIMWHQGRVRKHKLMLENCVFNIILIDKLWCKYCTPTPLLSRRLKLVLITCSGLMNKD